MSATFLSRVEETFSITDRGVVVAPGIPGDGKKYFVLIGDELEIRKPDGQRLITTVAGIEMANAPIEAGIGLLLSRDIRKEDVPIGSELWHRKKEPNQPLQRNASTRSVSNFESPARRG